jgi:hypothetical protein
MYEARGFLNESGRTGLLVQWYIQSCIPAGETLSSGIAEALFSHAERNPGYFSTNTPDPARDLICIQSTKFAWQLHGCLQPLSRLPMELMSLPAELLLKILKMLGWQYFSDDVRRLTVCKRWYNLAWPIFARELHLDFKSLPQFLENDEFFERAHECVGFVNLTLKGVHRDLGSRRPFSFEMGRRMRRWSEISSRLQVLATMLQRCPRLEHLSVVVSPEIEALAPQPFVDMISARHVHLTSLELHVPALVSFNERGMVASETAIPSTHLCRNINALLPSLRRLRCRMRHICEGILEPPPDDIPLRLDELIINFARPRAQEEPPEIINSMVGLPANPNLPRQYSTTCNRFLDPQYRSRPTPIGPPFPETRRAIEARAVALAARLPNPRIIRVIGLQADHETRRMVAFDAISRRRMFLEPDADWDAEGEVIVENQ